MSSAVTVVISVAGLGTRLGLDMPKCLVPVLGKPIMEWQLELLHDVDVVVVAGFEASKVIRYLRERHPRVPVVLNHRFRSTGTAASLALGAQLGADFIVSLDGDLLVAPEHLEVFVNGEQPLMGIAKRVSKTSVGVKVDSSSGRVVDAGFDVPGDNEWSGLLRLPREAVLDFADGHVFESLMPHLPIDASLVECVEVDEPEDIDRAAEWLSDRLESGDGQWTRK